MADIEFFTPANMAIFWDYVETLLKTISPGVMLVVAVSCVGLLLGIVVRSWVQASKKDKDEEDDEIEIRHY